MPQKITPSTHPAPIALFGGSFNPITQMHQEMILGLAQHFSQIWVLPSYVPPHKNSSELLPFELRLELCQVALQQLDLVDCVVSLCDFEKVYFEQTQGFTYLLLKKIQQNLAPNTPLHWVMGYDQLEKIHTWHQYQKLCTEFPLVVFSRNGQKPQNLVWNFDSTPPLFLEKTQEGPSATLIRQELNKLNKLNSLLESSPIEGLDPMVLKTYLKLKTQ